MNKMTLSIGARCVVMLSVLSAERTVFMVMLSVAMTNVITLRVVAPIALTRILFK
jgi:hypothetical protein